MSVKSPHTHTQTSRLMDMYIRRMWCGVIYNTVAIGYRFGKHTWLRICERICKRNCELEREIQGINHAFFRCFMRIIRFVCFGSNSMFIRFSINENNFYYICYLSKYSVFHTYQTFLVRIDFHFSPWINAIFWNCFRFCPDRFKHLWIK